MQAALTPTPNAVFDSYLKELSFAELKVLLAVLRHSYGMDKEWATIGAFQMRDLTGLSLGKIVLAIRRLQSRGLLARVIPGPNTPAAYALILPTENQTRQGEE